MYFNTNNETGDTLKESKQKTQTQEETILKLFRYNPLRLFTPDEIHSLLKTTSPLTSTRRAITVLTKKGHLEKTNVQRAGKFGKLVNCWKKANNN
jgi:hypothetical protein